MSFQDDECDFCGSYMDPIGCDTKQYVGTEAWCGGCDLSSVTAEFSETERKAKAYDELVALLVAGRRKYWNPRPEYLYWDRHFVWIDVEDGLNRIQSTYGLRGY